MEAAQLRPAVKLAGIQFFIRVRHDAVRHSNSFIPWGDKEQHHMTAERLEELRSDFVGALESREDAKQGSDAVSQRADDMLCARITATYNAWRTALPR